MFRKHKLQTEQVDNADAINDSTESSEDDEPEQIIVNRSAKLSSPPTQANTTDNETGTPTPKTSKYSTNPNRYNSGIFF